MRRSTASSSLATFQKQKNRKWTRQQLLKNLEILGPLSAPLPPDLPPSPPASRANSPLPSTKRKLDPSTDQESSKRPRTNIPLDRSSHHHQMPPVPPPHHHFRAPNPVFNMRSEPSEDGEVPEEIATASSSRGLPPAVVTTLVPVRRPRRGRPDYRTFDQMHDKYHHFGRLLKYSGDARFWSTYPATHKEYRPLPNPPPPNSPYHKFGGLIARLELVDALVCFAYSIWNRDYGRRQCSRDTWGTIEAFLAWCKHKWQAEDTVGDREKAFIGLIWMIEGFIKGRKQSFIARVLEPQMDKMFGEIQALAAAAAAEVEKEEARMSAQLVPGSTPPMLPSPASIAPASSANSTPINRANSTPNTASGSSSSALATRAQTSNLPSSATPPMSEAAAAAAAAVTLPINASTIQMARDQSAGVVGAAVCMGFGLSTLSLPIMARHFPTTFARMVHSSLGHAEEYEPDFEDEEGELFWPGQCNTGDGLGWVCLMGKAMIKEFGKDIGYRGLDGVVPKPKPEEQGPETPAGTGPALRPGQVGSAPQGSAER